MEGKVGLCRKLNFLLDQLGPLTGVGFPGFSTMAHTFPGAEGWLEGATKAKGPRSPAKQSNKQVRAGQTTLLDIV